MFQMRGLGAIDIDRPGFNPGSGVPQPPTGGGWGGGGSGGGPRVRFGSGLPSFTRGPGQLTPLAPASAPPSCPAGFEWGSLKNGQAGCFPIPTAVDQQNPTPGTNVTVGVEPGSPAYDEMMPWYTRPVFIFLGLGVATVLGVVIAKKVF